MRRHRFACLALTTALLAACTEPHGATPSDAQSSAYVLPVSLVFTRPPVSSVAGTTMLPVKVTLLGAHGEPAITSSDAVTIMLDGGGVGVRGTTTVNATRGVATFSDLRVDGTCTIRPATKTLPRGGGCVFMALAPGLPVVQSPLFEIRTGPPARLAFRSSRLVAAVGRPVAEQYSGTWSLAMVVRAVDLGGNPVDFAGDITLSLAASPAGGALSGDTVQTSVSAGATFGGVFIDKPGTGYRLRARADGLADTTSMPFTVTP